MKKIIFSLLLLFLSCKEEIKNEFKSIEKIKINIDNLSFDTNLFKKYEFVKIEGESIGRIRKFEIIPSQSSFVFTTTSGKNRVYIYNYKEKKIIPIISKGNGPREVSDVTDLYVDNMGNIYVLDMRRKKIHVVSKKGLYIKSIEVSDFYDEILIEEDLIVCVKKVPYNFNDYKISVLDTNFNVLKEYLSIPKIAYKRDFAQQKSIYKNGQNVVFNQSFSDTIYHIDDKGIYARYLLDFGNKKLPYDLYNNEKYDIITFVNKVKKSNNVWNISSVLENNKYMLISFRYSSKKNVHFTIYDKNTKQTTTSDMMDLSSLSLMNNATFNEDFYPVHMSDNSLFFIVEPYYLLESQNKGLKSSSNIDYGDNPLILKLDF